MTIETINRIIWRLKELKVDIVGHKQLRKAIMLEAGIDERTISKYIKKLEELDTLHRINRWYWDIKGEVY